MKINNLGKKGQERMLNNGWRIIVTDNCSETPEQLKERCENLGYNEVKIYWCGTQIKGIHTIFAMVKGTNNSVKNKEQIIAEITEKESVTDKFTIVAGNNRKFEISVCDDYDGNYYLVYGCLPWLGGKLERVAEQLANIENLVKDAEKEKQELKDYYDKYHDTDEMDWDWYSDWYKDVYGFRPH